jgi:hypothetical protein
MIGSWEEPTVEEGFKEIWFASWQTGKPVL